MKHTDLVALIILDGFGIAPRSKANATAIAQMSFFNGIKEFFPYNKLEASGLSVGLPKGQMGNSEVGHLTLGSGRVINQSLTRINLAIEDKSFFQNPAYLEAINHVKKYNSTLHFMGLVSDGGVHSELEHFKAFYDLFKAHGVENKTYLHAFLDGRDTQVTGGYAYVETLIKYGIKVGSVSGRYYAMDRDSNFDRIQKAYDVLTKDSKVTVDALEGIKNSYEHKVTDEFVIPFKVTNEATIKSNDAVIFVNYRPDRAIRISTALSNPKGLEEYYRPDKPTLKTTTLDNLCFVSTMHYASSVHGLLAFEPIYHKDLLGDVISRNNLKQLRIAETEKYAHVTFFFDGGEDKEIPNSKRVLIPSPKVATYDLKPEMSAFEVADKAIAEIKNNDYNLVVLNFANPDMVGHTGVINATVKALNAVDTNLMRVTNAVLEKHGVCIILADHGNCEEMLDSLGNPQTAHTTNPVPVIITIKNATVSEGSLKDVAPTILDLLGLDIPSSMTGKSLLTYKD
jgi:2,3-bisphosphoglycerate-independent phosphoglycerate mutase